MSTKRYQQGNYQGTPPTLADFREELLKQPEPEAKSLALELELFTRGSLNTFAKQTNVDTSNRLICYDILELGEQLRAIGMLVILDSIINRITANRMKGKQTFIFIDEIYLLFMHEYSAQFLFKLWKRVRKYKLAYGEEDYFDFGYDEFEPPVLTYDNTFVVGQQQLLDHFNEGMLSGILDAISASYRKEDQLMQMLRIAEKKTFEGELEINDLRRMIVFALYALKDPEGSCEKLILQLLKKMYEMMDDSGRSTFFDTIINVEIKESEKKNLVDYFGLYYVITSEASQETVDKIMSIDTFLGIRSVMKCPRTQWAFHSLTASLGFDIMKEMTKKMPDGSLKVEATYEMFGDTNYFYNMFDWESVLKLKNYKPPKLDLSKKPEDELIFWSDGFINLMVKWYFRYFNRQGKNKELENETAALAKDVNRMANAVGKVAGDDVQDYLSKAIVREPENNGGFYPLIAFSAKAGMVFALHDFGKIKLTDNQYDLMIRFINNMTVIFPELIKRDILMAELYLYLKEV